MPFISELCATNFTSFRTVLNTVMTTVAPIHNTNAIMIGVLKNALKDAMARNAVSNVSQETMRLVITNVITRMEGKSVFLVGVCLL